MKVYLITVLCFITAVAFFTGCISENNDREKEMPAGCGRIVSTAPSITETLFELGLGGNVQGVTESCKYPEEAAKITRIGSVLDVNMETVISLRPDTVFVISANSGLVQRLQALNIKTFIVDQSTVAGFMKSLDEIGQKCAVSQKAAEIKSAIEKRMKTVRSGEKKKIMVVAGRDYFSSDIKDVYIAGNDGFYSELIKLAGHENVYDGVLSYPKIQVEGLISLDPDIIFDVITNGGMCENSEKYLKSWSALRDLKAVKNGSVFMICKDYWSIPGPRFMNIVEDIQLRSGVK